MQVQIELDAAFEAPTEPLATNADYVGFVMNMAAKSYMQQFGAATIEDGLTAAREAFNASLPEPAPPEE